MGLRVHPEYQDTVEEDKADIQQDLSENWWFIPERKQADLSPALDVE